MGRYAHDYGGQVNSRARRQDTKIRRVVPPIDLRRLEDLLATDRPKKEKEEVSS